MTMRPTDFPGGADSIERAWYGPRSGGAFNSRGKDVTAKVKDRVQRGQNLRPDNKVFGDPALFSIKILVVEYWA